MKTVSIVEARRGLSAILDEAQHEPVCLLRHGKPVAIIAGVEGVELGTVILEGRLKFRDAMRRARASKKGDAENRRRLMELGGSDPAAAAPPRRRPPGDPPPDPSF